MWPIFTAATVEHLRGVLHSHQWSISSFSTGAPLQNQRFAELFARYCGVAYCVPTATGTSSLLIALEALDIGPGDEVIVPGLTWVAPASAVLNANAIPVLVDVDPHTGCMDAAAVASRVTAQTRAIIAIHLYCSMVDMDALGRVAAAHDLPIIEDCAQAHGSVFSGRRAGSLGTIGAFSMHAGKVLTCGEGGAAVTQDRRLFERMEQLHCDGRRIGKPTLGHNHLEDVGEVMGNNYTMSEFDAALLIDALERLDEQNRHREANARYLGEGLRSLGGLYPMGRPAQVDRQTYYHYAVQFDREAFAGRSAAAVCAALEAELGLYVHSTYPPLNRNALYRPHSKRRYRLSSAQWERLDPRAYELPVAAELHERTIVFHHSALLGPRSDMDLLVEGFSRVKRFADEVPNA